MCWIWLKSPLPRYRRLLMWVPFETMPGHARLWIYGADRSLNASEIEPDLKSFVSEWTSHKVALEASVQVMNQFLIVLAVKEQGHTASGCSIDKATHFMEDLGQRLGMNLLERKRYYVRDHDAVHSYEHDAFVRALQDQRIGLDTIVADTLINKVSDLPSLWKPLGNSWHRRLFGL